MSEIGGWCFRQPVRRSHVSAFATGRASERSIFVRSKLSRHPVNQAPDEHVSIVPVSKPAQCLRTLFKTYRNAFRTCRGERRIRSW